LNRKFNPATAARLLMLVGAIGLALLAIAFIVHHALLIAVCVLCYALGSHHVLRHILISRARKTAQVADPEHTPTVTGRVYRADGSTTQP
jgi:fatty acid desaturase